MKRFLISLMLVASSSAPAIELHLTTSYLLYSGIYGLMKDSTRSDGRKRERWETAVLAAAATWTLGFAKEAVDGARCSAAGRLDCDLDYGDILANTAGTALGFGFTFAFDY